jgi:DNA replication and repair protein RecF
VRLTSLLARNFRNLEELHLSFDAQRNLLIGKNGAGKSNVLEAIYYLCVSRSPRGALDGELVRWGADFFHLEGRGERRRGPFEVTATVRGGQKEVGFNGVRLARISELVGEIAVVSLSQDDTKLTKGPPSQRRRFLDIAVSQISRIYLQMLNDYRRTLQQRNRVLLVARESGGVRAESLEPWDEQLVSLGARIIVERQSAMEELVPRAIELYGQLGGGRDSMDLVYAPTVGDGTGMSGDELANEFRDKLVRTRRAEIERGQTLVGPHRDDIEVAVGGRNLRTYGSEGQHRSAAIALRLGEADLLRRHIGEDPVFVLDEVFSELDRDRAGALVTILEEWEQIFLATTRSDSIEARDLEAATFLLEDGAFVEG